MTQTQPVIEITKAFEPLFNEEHPNYKSRYLTWYGGRGGAKSWQIARGLLIRAMKEPILVACFREFQVSIADSVIAVLKVQAEILGVDSFFDFQKNVVYGANGSQFIFKGFHHNLSSIKSIEGIDVAWVEEAQTAAEESWRTLNPTVRKAGSQIITSYNTGDETDPTYQRTVINPPDDAYLSKVNYLDNPWCPQEIIDEAEWMQRVDPEAYANIFLGEPWSRTDSQVLRGKWRVGVMEIPDDASPCLGADFGFSNDPSTLTESWIIGKTLYINKELWKIGVEIDDYVDFYDKMPSSRKYKIRADSARPELISHIKKKGFNIVSCKKWPGSVEDGISVLRNFNEIVINPECVKTIEEARMWSYKTDRLTGDVLPKLKDGFEHCFDSVRYALETLMKTPKEPQMRTT